MAVKARCKLCDHVNEFEEKILRKKIAVYTPLKTSGYHLPQVVIKKCKSCGAMVKVKLEKNKT